MKSKTNVGFVLKDKRQMRNWSLRELAKRSGISAATICRIENGADPTFGQMVTLFGAMGIWLKVSVVPNSKKLTKRVRPQ